MPLPWQHKINHGRKAKLRKFPTRERLLIRQALDTLRLRYWQQVRFWSPDFRGEYNVNGNYQWIDFLIRMPHGKLGALILNPQGKSGYMHIYEREASRVKQDFLSKRGIPNVVLPKSYSRDEYQIFIEMWIRKEKVKHVQKQARR